MDYISSRAALGVMTQAIKAQQPPAWTPAVSMEIMSDQATENYPWLSATPAMREWVGGRNAKGFTENNISVTNKHYEDTLAVKVKDLRRDKFGTLKMRINELARRAKSHRASLLSTLIINGAATACYDGQYFFDTDHSEGSSGTQSNDLTIDISTLPVTTGGTTTYPAVAEMQLCIAQAISAICGFKDSAGEPVNEDANQFLVMVPTSLGPAARQAVYTPQQVAETQTALTALKSKFSIDVEVNPRLDASWTLNFAVFRTDSYIKPFIFQRETNYNVSAIAEGSEHEFKNDEHLYGVDYWGNVAYALWQYACLVTMS